jgi:Toprim-like
MATQVDFSKVRLIPISSILALYKVETRKRSNTELVANCPFPSHAQSSKEHKWTLAISLEKNRWYCHSDTCRAAGNKPKGGDVIDVVAMMENLTPLDAAKKLSELFCVGNGHPAPKVEASEVNKPLAFELKGLDPDHPFIRERGISIETAMDFGVGFFPGKGSMANRVCFPLFENGALIGYAGRTVLPVSEENPKWRLPAGIHRTFLYGLEKCDPAKPLALLESPWGVLHLYQHHVQAAALIGTSLTDAQEKLLEPYADIRICMDNDTAGRDAAAKIADRLKGKHKISRAYLRE